MARMNTFLTVTPTIDDLVLGLDNTNPSVTRTFSVSGLLGLFYPLINNDIITQTISIGVTDKAPSSNAVYEALLLKQKVITLTTLGTNGIATFNPTTGALNIPESTDNQNLQSVTNNGASTTNPITITVGNGGANGITSFSSQGYGVRGGSSETNGVYGTSGSGAGVYGFSGSEGVIGEGSTGVKGIGYYGVHGKSDNGVGVLAEAYIGIGLSAIADGEGTAIYAYSTSGKGIEVNGNGTIAIEANLGNSNKGLVINSGTSSIGKFIELNKNGVDKFTINQQGEQSIVKIPGGTGTNVLLDNGSTAALSSIGGNQNLQEVTDKGNITNKTIIANVALANPAIVGYSQTGNGVYGQSDGKGVYGYSFFDAAVYGYAESATGIAIKGYAEDGIAAEFETDASDVNTNIVNFKKSGILKASVGNGGDITANSITTTIDSTINGVRVGRGNISDPLSENTAIGYQALQSVVHTTGNTGYSNTAIGHTALKSLTTGFANDAFGNDTLNLCTTGTYNTAMGSNALRNLTTGTQNLAVGTFALLNNITGERNVAVGVSALMNNTGSYNTAIGTRAGGNVSSTGEQNIIIGYQAGMNISSGRLNLLIECTDGGSITTGSNNIILNPRRQSGITTGSNNTIIGGFNNSLSAGLMNNVIIATGLGVVRFQSTDTGLTTVPSQTNALIIADTTGKAIATKEYVSSVAGGATNLSTTQTANNFTINSDTGDDALVPLGNGTLAGATLNDYTTTEKDKLSGIATGAEVNVNADWNATSGDAQILNKPTILAAPPITIVNDSSLFSTGLIGTGDGSNATDSNFFGAGAGREATDANNSNFFGNNAGYQAINTSSSNFFGNVAGYKAENVSSSNFFGSAAGYESIDTQYSNFFGYYAGFTATGASNSNFFGQEAGNLAVGASSSNFLGTNTGNGATDANRSNFLGERAGFQATNASYSNFLGYQAGAFFTDNNIGSNNIIIGTNISLPNSAVDSINLGGVLFGTGTYSETANDPSITPTSGGKIGIGVVEPTSTLHIYSETANTSGLRLERLTSASPTTTGQAIGVDVDGNVVTVEGGGGSQDLQSVTTNGSTTTDAIQFINPLDTNQKSNASYLGYSAIGEELNNSLSSTSMLNTGIRFYNSDIGSETLHFNANLSTDDKSDWGYTNNYFIPKKPEGSYTLATIDDIQTTTSQLTNNGADGVNPFITALDIPSAQVNSDWDATSGAAEILNKPTIPTTTSYLINDGADGENPYITALDIPIYGQSATLVREVRNTTGATLTKGTVVYINGANGNKPTVAKALATTDALSARTFGLLQTNLANNTNGYVVVIGDLSGLDTSAFTEGVQLYLSGATAGTYTATKTLAPTHLVYVGKVTRSHPTQGQIEVGIQNGYELEEIHDVAISGLANEDFLQYELSTDLWKNKPLTDTLIKSKLGITTLSGSNTGDDATNTQYSGLATSKQDTLESTVNIKSINGNSILGGGDLVISSDNTAITGADSPVALADFTGSIVNTIVKSFPTPVGLFTSSKNSFWLRLSVIKWNGLGTCTIRVYFNTTESITNGNQVLLSTSIIPLGNTPANISKTIAALPFSPTNTAYVTNLVTANTFVDYATFTNANTSSLTFSSSSGFLMVAFQLSNASERGLLSAFNFSKI